MPVEGCNVSQSNLHEGPVACAGLSWMTRGLSRTPRKGAGATDRCYVFGLLRREVSDPGFCVGSHSRSWHWRERCVTQIKTSWFGPELPSLRTPGYGLQAFFTHSKIRHKNFQIRAGSGWFALCVGARRSLQGPLPRMFPRETVQWGPWAWGLG